MANPSLTIIGAVGAGLVGLATVAVLVGQKSQTPAAITAATGGLAAIIGAAVAPVSGGASGNIGGGVSSYLPASAGPFSNTYLNPIPLTGGSPFGSGFTNASSLSGAAGSLFNSISAPSFGGSYDPSLGGAFTSDAFGNQDFSGGGIGA